MDNTGPVRIGKSRQEARQLIDDAVAHLKSQIADLHSQRNLLAPICRLPPEILGEIFLLAKGSTYYADFYVHDYYGWIKRLTHVCRHLRNVALASPQLWSKGPWPLHKQNFLDEILRRSKENPLVIKVDLTQGDSGLVGLEGLLENHHQRIKHLAILVDSSDWVTLQRSFPKSTPQLRHLSISCNTRFPAPVFAIDNTFDAPALRHLAVSHFAINWDLPFPLGHGLTYLKIHLLPDPPPTWRQFFNSLSQMPSLEVLDLQDKFPIDENERESAVLHLASLRMLIIGRCGPREVIQFLSRVTFPSTTKIKIAWCSGTRTTQLKDTLPDLLKKVTQSTSNAAVPNVFQTLVVLERPHNSHIHHGICVRLFSNALDDKEMLCHSNVDSQLELDFYWRFEETCDFAMVLTIIFKSEIGTLLRDSIICVYLAYISQEPNHDLLENTIGELRKVRHIATMERWLRSLAELLQRSGEGSDSGISPRTLYFPDLSSLYLVNAHGEQPFPIKLLHDCIVSRTSAGASIQKLTLRSWNKIKEDDMNLLEEVAEEIDSDDEDMQYNSDDNYSDYVELLRIY
ncbi:hypothetical protein BDN70DRAFT_585071 [Pholiota conissans]|uniref:F-box domain-containing protein n=1 Tax=Pholiota conissans TaxID=109636 RepID=A0A9P5Z460_9AGAR|nr:hypothetical protein BDN70DRAFT_585071 [Pholiota conissans]